MRLPDAPLSSLDALRQIMRALRDPDGGCPWDVEQSFETIAPFAIEEAYEVVDRIERKDLNGLKDELGDLLLQVAYHAQMAEEIGAFTFEDVISSICSKMIRRHPHVFGDEEGGSATAQIGLWEELKAQERAEAAAKTPDAEEAAGGARPSVLDDIPLALPAVARSVKLQKRLGRVGFGWERIEDLLAKVREETGELMEAVASGDIGEIEGEAGDLLFTAADLARGLGVDPETALRRANAKVERRFRYIEAGLAADGLTPEEATTEQMEALWQQAKAEERAAAATTVAEDPAA